MLATKSIANLTANPKNVAAQQHLQALNVCHFPKTTGSGRLSRPTCYSGTAVVAFTRSSTKLVLQSCTLGCLSRVSMIKRL